MEENINDFLGIADSSIDSIKNLNTELDKTITKLGTLAEQAELLNKNLQNAGIKDVTKSMEDLNDVTLKINKTNSERLNIEREIKVEGAKAAKIIMTEVEAFKQVDKVLQETTISFGELSQQLVDQQYKLDKNKAKQKELRDEIKAASTDLKNGKITRDEYSVILDKNNEKLADLTITEAKYRAELSKSKSDLKVLVTEQKSAEGSMDQMNARLGYLRDTYRKLSQSERENADVGGVLQSSISELDDALKMLDKQIGNNQRNVGNYELGNQTLKQALKDVRNELAGLNFNYDQIAGKIKAQKLLTDQLAASKGIESDEFKAAKAEVTRLEQAYITLKARMTELTKVGGDMQDAMSDTSASMKNMGDDTANIKAVAEGASVMVDGFQVVQASMVALGIESDSLINIFAKMQILQQGINSVMAIANTLQKQSTLMLKIREVRDKIRLAYTEALTAQQVKNTAATAASAVATEGLAGAEVTATKTSFSLSAAIKSIPGIGWILGIVAALGTLAVILYKVMSAEKELTSEQIARKKLAQDLNEINGQVIEQTTETVVRVRLLTKELGNVKKGSKDYKDIVDEINELTGSQYNYIKDMPKEILKGTEEWIKQYKLRAKSEAIIQQIVQSEIEYEKNRAEFLASGTEEKRRDELAKTFNLLDDERKLLLTYRRQYMTTTDVIKKQELYDTVLEYLDAAKQKMIDNNKLLENQITLEGMTGGDKKKTKKDPKKEAKDNFDYQKGIEEQIIRMQLEGVMQEEALREMRINNLKKEKNEKLKVVKEGSQQEKDIIQYYANEIEKVRIESNDKITKLEDDRIERIRKNNEILVNTLTELEEIRLSNSNISEKELTDKMIKFEIERTNEIVRQNNIARDKEIKGLEDGSEEYLSVKNKYEALNQLVLEKSILTQEQIRKNGYAKTVENIKKQIELSKAKAIVNQGGALTQEQESQFAITGIQNQISALDIQASTLDPLTQAYRDYINERKLLEADLTLETQKQSQLRMEQMQKEKSDQLELAGAIGGAVFAIGDALTQNIQDEKKRVRVEQSLAVAKVLFNQAIAISEAVALAATTSGSVYTIPIAIATSVGSIVAAMLQAQMAISQANSSVASAYAEGTSFHTGGGAIVGEGGQPELVKAGGTSFVVDQPTYFKDFPVGAQVIPFDKLTNEQTDMSETNELLKLIAGKQQVNINFGRTTNSQLIKGLTRTTILNRRFKA